MPTTPAETMTRCETKRLYKVDGKKSWRWVEVAVADVSADDSREIRCAYCHGAIKVDKRRGEQGPQEHVKHRLREDTDNCQGGRAAQGAHGLSSHPVD